MNTQDHSRLPVFVTIADGDVDLIQQTTRKLNQEHVNDLRRMGCRVSTHRFPTWEDAQSWADAHEPGRVY